VILPSERYPMNQVVPSGQVEAIAL